MSNDPLATYRADVARALRAGIATEHTYRPYLKTLVEAVKAGIIATNEPKRVKCGAPDYVVSENTSHGPMTVGYIEAKDVGVPLDTIPDTDQGERYLKALGNLIFTDYIDFRWYVGGVLRSSARLGTIDRSQTLTLRRGGREEVEALLRDFLSHSPAEITKPKELAERMARLTHIIRDMVVSVFTEDEASEMLCDLRQAFSQILLPDLDTKQFADMFAQTIAYGLFAARVNHPATKGRFHRLAAAGEIPRTNPFLRKLFSTITGTDLDDEPFVGFVDDLVQLLADTDMDAVLADFGKRSGQEDPVVHFYETFLKAYDPGLRNARGVYYTPEPVVSYIVRSSDILLKMYFGCADGLADTSTASYTYKNEENEAVAGRGPKVLILDPACGTGTFLYSVVDLIRREFKSRNDAGKWAGYVRSHLMPRIFGFELLMAPYAVAHLKLGLQLGALDLPEEERADWVVNVPATERLGVYLTNTLEQALHKSQLLLGSHISEEANAASQIKRDRPVLVVLGNPPYSGKSENKGMWIETLLKGQDYGTEGRTENYFEVDGQPLDEIQVKWLHDDYVKFIRWAQWRIERTGAGLLAFITNRGYLDNPTFRGMRQSLMNTFTDIYILDLHGASKKKDLSPDGTRDVNVFDIQQGVCIGLFVKQPGKEKASKVHYAERWGSRESKYAYLLSQDVQSTEWSTFEPAKPFYLFIPHRLDLAAEYSRGYSLRQAMPVNSVGIVTARDDLTTGWDEAEVLKRVKDFAKLAVEQAREKYKLGADARDWKVESAQNDINSATISDNNIVSLLYRPFDLRYTYYTGNRGFIGQPQNRVMRHMLKGRNLGLIASKSVEIGRGFEHVFSTRTMIQHHAVSIKEVNYLFPLYLYPSDQEVSGGLYPKDERRANFAPEFTKYVEAQLVLTLVPAGTGDLISTIGPEDLFNYIYALLHSLGYRARYGQFLRSDFPRVHCTDDQELFRILVDKGSTLVDLHILESPAIDERISHYPVPGPNKVEPTYPKYLAPGEPEPGSGTPLTEGRVYISKDVLPTKIRGQYFEGVPREVWDHHIGGFQICEKWLKDRRGLILSNDDIGHYERVLVAIDETIRLTDEIDAAIENHGGWPI